MTEQGKNTPLLKVVALFGAPTQSFVSASSVPESLPCSVSVFTHPPLQRHKPRVHAQVLQLEDEAKAASAVSAQRSKELERALEKARFEVVATKQVGVDASRGGRLSGNAGAVGNLCGESRAGWGGVGKGRNTCGRGREGARVHRARPTASEDSHSKPVPRCPPSGPQRP
eukprot:350137-Chlamydomonas_euryale.AAC.5